MPEVANLILNDGTCGDMRYEKALLKKQGEWFDGGGTLFVFSSGNPATIWKKVELVPPGNGVTLYGLAFSHIRFENLSFRKIGTHGIQMAQGPVGVTIRRCDFTLIGGASGFQNERKVLETDQVTNGLHGGPRLEGFKLPDPVLNHIYYWNAARLIPRVRQVLEARNLKIGFELGTFKCDRLPPDVIPIFNTAILEVLSFQCSTRGNWV